MALQTSPETCGFPEPLDGSYRANCRRDGSQQHSLRRCHLQASQGVLSANASEPMDSNGIRRLHSLAFPPDRQDELRIKRAQVKSQLDDMWRRSVMWQQNSVGGASVTNLAVYAEVPCKPEANGPAYVLFLVFWRCPADYSRLTSP